MSIEACIAHAIHTDLDILEILPDVGTLTVEEMEPYIERFVLDIHESLYKMIVQKGEPYLRSKDAAGLCATLLDSGATIPAPMLLKMCQTILNLSQLDARFILDTEDGKSLYYVKMNIA